MDKMFSTEVPWNLQEKLIPGPLWIEKSADASVPCIKWHSYLHITYSHPSIYFKSSLN